MRPHHHLHRSARAAIATLAIACGGQRAATPVPDASSPLDASRRLPTGARLDPAGRAIAVGNMPIAALASPDGRYVALSLAGWREQGVDLVDRSTSRVVQHVEQAGAFLGLAWSADGSRLYASGGTTDLVYVYAMRSGAAAPLALTDSIAVGHADGRTVGSRYPAGIALSREGRSLYVAENLSDSLAVVDVATGRVRQRLGVGEYPYAVVAAPDGRVYVSAWGANHVAVFRADSSDRLAGERPIDVGRHPSAMTASADGSRLYVASASTDRVAVVDTKARRTVRWLLDPPPGDVAEGSTPNALALSPSGDRLYVAEADANAVAVFSLSAESSGLAGGASADSLLGRIPVAWYPTSVVATRDSLFVVNGKGLGTGPNPRGPRPDVPLEKGDPRSYTLGQLDGTVSVFAVPHHADLGALTTRVAHANGWDAPTPAWRHPPIEHVVYIIKENRTYDQVLGDLPQGDGDTSLVFFPRAISPNHHALAERFGLFDRFFTNAEVSNQGHPWSTAGYVTDFLEKTTPDDYRLKRPEHDDAGDADDPAAGYLWDSAIRRGVSLRDYGEYGENVPRAPGDSVTVTRSVIASLAPYTSPSYPAFDIGISDQRRADAWLAELHEQERTGRMPALEIMHLPGDHTAGARPRRPTPRAYMADNDLALGRIVEALSRSPFWRSTAVFVVEDDAQGGPDHVDSHRSVLLVLSPWSRGGVLHRFVNTTDVLATIEDLLGLPPLSSFDRFGRPLREIWRDTPDLTPYVALAPRQSLAELNVAVGPDARRSEAMDLRVADRIDDAAFNRILWRAIKGTAVPYPRARRASTQELARGW